MTGIIIAVPLVMPSEFVTIMGSSGSGKSTFMNMIGCRGRVPPKGWVYFGSKSVKEMTDDKRTTPPPRDAGRIIVIPGVEKSLKNNPSPFFPSQTKTLMCNSC